MVLYNKDFREVYSELVFDYIIIDPPFNIGFKYDKHNDKMSEKDYIDMLSYFKGKKVVVIQYPEETMRYVIPALGIPDKVVSWVYNSNTRRNHRLISFFNCSPDFNKIKPSFFIERNNLPFDAMIQSLVWKYTDKAKRYPVYLSKSIYYKNKEDYKALQTYKILCNRSFGRVASLSSPNLNHFGSNEFCLESYKEHVNNLYTPL